MIAFLLSMKKNIAVVGSFVSVEVGRKGNFFSPFSLCHPHARVGKGW
jgi:hypothetical protein